MGILICIYIYIQIMYFAKQRYRGYNIYIHKSQLIEMTVCWSWDSTITILVNSWIYNISQCFCLPMKYPHESCLSIFLCVIFFHRSHEIFRLSGDFSHIEDGHCWFYRTWQMMEFLGTFHSYGHLPVITGYKWDYTFHKWGFVSTYNW